MGLKVSTVMLGVRDLARAKAFYSEGLGCAVDKDFPTFVSFALPDGSSGLALYEWDAAAQDAGVSPEGSGFRGASFHIIVSAKDEVDALLAAAESAVGSIVKSPEGAEWGGYFGYFGDPDGYLWKVAAE